MPDAHVTEARALNHTMCIKVNFFRLCRATLFLFVGCCHSHIYHVADICFSFPVDCHAFNGAATHSIPIFKHDSLVSAFILIFCYQRCYCCCCIVMLLSLGIDLLSLFLSFLLFFLQFTCILSLATVSQAGYAGGGYSSYGHGFSGFGKEQ